jgi:HEAT repeat protein
MLKHAAAQLRGTSDEGYERFKRICHAAGIAIVAPLAEALSSEQDARARKRLRDILLGFGAQGRESIQPLMHSTNWEVRRTAAYLLREFGGTEGLKELVPLLTDTEPLVQREAIQALVMNGTDGARSCPRSPARSGPRRRSAELANKDERAAPLFVTRGTWIAAFPALLGDRGPRPRRSRRGRALKTRAAAGDWMAPLRRRRGPRRRKALRHDGRPRRRSRRCVTRRRADGGFAWPPRRN